MGGFIVTHISAGVPATERFTSAGDPAASTPSGMTAPVATSEWAAMSARAPMRAPSSTVARVATALRDAGARSVMAVGGDVAGLHALGLDARLDPRQGDGPLGGVVTALELAEDPVVVVLATDLAWLGPEVVGALVERLGTE